MAFSHHRNFPNRLPTKQVLSGNTTQTHTFGSPMSEFCISNDGQSDLSFTIGAITVTVKAGEVFEELFEPFASVTITTTVPYRALVR